MARLDLHGNRADKGYLLDVQADILRALNSRLVIPVLPIAEAPPIAGRLNPLVMIEGMQHSVVAQHMAAVSSNLLGIVVASLADRDIEITGAIDLLIPGI
jgi:toxin CcdB